MLDGCGMCFVCSADRQIGSEVESGLLVFVGVGVVHVASLGAQAILQQRLRSDRELLFVGMWCLTVEYGFSAVIPKCRGLSEWFKGPMLSVAADVIGALSPVGAHRCC